MGFMSSVLTIRHKFSYTTIPDRDCWGKSVVITDTGSDGNTGCDNKSTLAWNSGETTGGQVGGRKCES